MSARKMLVAFIALLSLVAAHAAYNLKSHFNLAGIYADGEPALHVFAANRDLVEGANRLFVALEVKEGDLWNSAMLERLRQLHERVALLEDIDAIRVRSLWKNNILVLRASPSGLATGKLFDVHPASGPPSPLDMSIEARRGGAVGRYVSEDGRHALIVAPLKAQGVEGETPVDYRRLSRQMQMLREQFSDDKTRVNFSGPPLWVALAMVQSELPRLWLFVGALTVVMLLALGFGSLMVAALAVLCVSLGLLWTLGLWSYLMGGLSPYAALILAPVAVFGLMLAVLYGAALTRQLGQGVYRAASSALRGLRRVFLFATIAAAGVSLSLVFARLDVIREAGLLAGMGVLAQTLAVSFVMPLLAGYLPQDKRHAQALRSKRLERHAYFVPLLRLCRRRPILCLLSLILAVGVGYALLPGPKTYNWPLAPRAAASMSPSALYYENLSENFPAGLSSLSLIIQAEAKSCINPAVVAYLEFISRDFAQQPAVVKVRSLPNLLREASAADHQGHPKWLAIPRHSLALLDLMSRLPSDMPLAENNCSLLTLHADLNGRENPSALLSRAEYFYRMEPPGGLPLSLSAPTGDAALTAAAQNALAREETRALFRATAILIVAACLAFLHGQHAVIALWPALIIILLGTGIAPVLQAGRDVTTLPLVVVWAGVGGAMGIAMQRAIAEARERGEEAQEAGFEAIRRRGSALFVASAAGGVLLSLALFSYFPLEAAGGLVGFVFLFLLALATVLIQPLIYASWTGAR
jgi:predicted RND superfamily exporter protein